MIHDHGEHVLAAVGGSTEDLAETLAGLGDVLRPARRQALLRIDVRSQLRELGDSRRRLLDAGDAERRKLEAMLHDGAIARVRTVAHLVEDTDGLEGLRERVDRTLMELDGVARGIDPLAGRCLRTALSELAHQSAVQIAVDAPSVDPPAHIARAVWYTCSEAIANAAKHAPGSHLSITLHNEDSTSVLDVVDDGPGGADPSGNGLRGLADRASALGGSLSIGTDANGTRIMLRVPITGEV
jgi:glucose-6-phosphate-specific signal transduction histidine kinase